MWLTLGYARKKNPGYLVNIVGPVMFCPHNSRGFLLWSQTYNFCESEDCRAFILKRKPSYRKCFFAAHLQLADSVLLFSSELAPVRYLAS